MDLTFDELRSIDLTFDELKRELRRVEQSLLMLEASDAFVEDLVSQHAYRRALLAALADCPESAAQRSRTATRRGRRSQKQPARAVAMRNIS
jgi:hypothetical protein